MEKLLVIMTEHDCVQKLMPCLETLARPGGAVIFLFQYPVDSRSYFRDHRITVESARHATAVGRNIMHRYDWEAQKELAQQIIAPTVAALHNNGVQVEIHLYSGRLAKAIKNYTVNRDIHWILTQFPRPGLIGYLSTKNLVPLGWSSHLLSVPTRAFARSKSSKDVLSKGLARWTEWCLGRVPVVPVKEGKTMIAGKLLQGSPVPVRATEGPRQLSEIAHDLKNCMSILLYWVETFETDGGSAVPSEDGIDDLKKLADKMNCLIERLDSL